MNMQIRSILKRLQVLPDYLGGRFLEIDLIKAFSILFVIAIHVVSNFSIKQDIIEIYILEFASFAVPSLYFCSGFLFKKEYKGDRFEIPKAMLRILGPYLTVSFFILLGSFYLKQEYPQVSFNYPNDLSIFFWDLLFAETRGIYYFIFVLTYLYLFGFLMRKLPLVYVHLMIALGVVVVFLMPIVGFQSFFPFQIPPGKEFFYLIRYPALPIVFFYSGWLLSFHYTKFRSAIEKIPAIFYLMLAATILVIVYNYLSVHSSTMQTVFRIFYPFSMIFLLIGVGVKFRRKSRVLVFLSMASYPIYLYHIFFVDFVKLYLSLRGNFLFPNRLIFPFLAGLLGGVLVVFFAKLLFAKKTKYIIGV